MGKKLDRLVRVEKEGASADFLYDSFGRCLKIKDASGERVLLHQKDKEIGSLFNGQLDEFRLVHPANETVFALELQGRVFFPVQDERFCVCALQNSDGSLANWTRQSAFEQTAIYGEKSLVNPWTFGNRRNVAGLALFAHRVYNPQLMRWQTADPLGFEEGLNLYRYNRNNPYRFYDPDGRNALVLTFVSFSFGVALGPLVFPTLAAVGAATLMYGAYQTVVHMQDYRMKNAVLQNDFEQKIENIEPDKVVEIEKKGRKAGRDNKIKGGPPRDHKTADYLPDPLAEGTPHTTIGTRKGRHEDYTQGATFNEQGKFEGRTDVTNHGRADHAPIHYHPATGPNSADSPAEFINFNY